MIVWRLGAKIVRTVLCCIVYGSCAQSYTHTHTHTCEQFLNLQVGLGLDFVFVCLFNLVFLRFFVLYSCVACFCCVGYSFFSTKPRDWLGRTSLKLPVLCRMVRKTLTQSVKPVVLPHADIWLEADSSVMWDMTFKRQKCWVGLLQVSRKNWLRKVVRCS